MRFFKNMLRDEAGATAIEYGLIAALIAVAAITAMGTIGDELTNTFNDVSTELVTART
jgi:pilus assembly protein Flp/PilA